ncbi:MAG TPA: hypothetical protein PLQ79_04065 [Candidatus Cloacimonadota bacterium]|jgi:predicted helicase|nr:hypothetical protein [Candidatus Cloacimonadota bacterium]
MMAPYTVGHLKISYLLAEHGYELCEEKRFKLYLSNTLEPDTPQQTELPIAHDISEECALANKVKHEEPIMVIMGNPPYSGASENNNAWTEKLLKTDLDGAQSYYTVDGMPLNEKNPKGLQDDYVKFLRFAQWKIHKAGKGIVGMITNHGYLDNPTFRGMRQSLMRTFDEIYVLDLHGNSLKGETCDSTDENVFDIKQGTAIILMVKGVDSKETRVCHHELFGLRQSKYDWLENKQFQSGDYQELNPGSPFYLFRPEAAGNEHYLQWRSLPEIFPLNSVGIVTARDGLTIRDTPDQVRNTIHHFASLDPESARAAYQLGKDAKDWKVELAQKDLKDSGLSNSKIVPILYRPFDTRYTYFTGKSGGFHCRARNEVMRYMLEENVGIIARRQQLTGKECNYVFISKYIISDGVIRSDNKGSESVFPLYIYPDEQKEDIFASDEREYNIASGLLEQFSRQWPQFQPEQLFYYVYAVLHSNQYRQRFAQYLRMDFPRIPFTDDYELFGLLAGYGKELADIHLLKSPRLNTPIAKYQGSGSNDLVEFIKYEDKSIVQINPDKHFEGITPELWNYHIGGYQVLHKYMKGHKGKSLSNLIHYCLMVIALALTIDIQAKK